LLGDLRTQRQRLDITCRRIEQAGLDARAHLIGIILRPFDQPAAMDRRGLDAHDDLHQRVDQGHIRR
jgi:hypothetical protein